MRTYVFPCDRGVLCVRVQLVDLVARILALVPPWVRIYRIQRDIPMPLVRWPGNHILSGDVCVPLPHPPPVSLVGRTRPWATAAGLHCPALANRSDDV